MNERAILLARSMVQDPYPTPDYSVCTTAQSVTDYVYSGSDGYRDLNPRILIGEDTESTPDGQLFCMTFSVRPGSARLIYAHDRSLIDRYRSFLIANDPHHVFHNYLHDVIPFTALNLPIDRFTDTMVRAYNLCLGGGGDSEDGESRAGRGLLSLKVLAWRHLHMRMTSFVDTVHPYSIPHALTWLEQARALVAPLPKKMCGCGHSRDRHVPRGKTGKLMGRCPHCACAQYKERKELSTKDSKLIGLLHTKCNRLIVGIKNQEEERDEYGVPTGEPINPWKRVKGWHDHDREMLEPVLGVMPAPSVAHVPELALVHYACRDADATLRMLIYMRKLKPWLFYSR